MNFIIKVPGNPDPAKFEILGAGPDRDPRNVKHPGAILSVGPGQPCSEGVFSRNFAKF